MPPGTEPSRLVHDLLGTYQHATYVFLTRDPALWTAVGGVPGVERITPELLADVEDAAMAAQTLIRMLFTARKEASLNG